MGNIELPAGFGVFSLFSGTQSVQVSGCGGARELGFRTRWSGCQCDTCQQSCLYYQSRLSMSLQGQPSPQQRKKFYSPEWQAPFLLCSLPPPFDSGSPKCLLVQSGVSAYRPLRTWLPICLFVCVSERETNTKTGRQFVCVWERGRACEGRRLFGGCLSDLSRALLNGKPPPVVFVHKEALLFWKEQLSFSQRAQTTLPLPWRMLTHTQAHIHIHPHAWVRVCHLCLKYKGGMSDNVMYGPSVMTLYCCRIWLIRNFVLNLLAYVPIILCVLGKSDHSNQAAEEKNIWWINVFNIPRAWSIISASLCHNTSTWSAECVWANDCFTRCWDPQFPKFNFQPLLCFETKDLPKPLHIFSSGGVGFWGRRKAFCSQGKMRCY